MGQELLSQATGFQANATHQRERLEKTRVGVSWGSSAGMRNSNVQGLPCPLEETPSILPGVRSLAVALTPQPWDRAVMHPCI